MKYNTTALYLSGAVCGPIWQGSFCGMPIQRNLRTRSPGVLRAILKAQGDFQHAQFTADTVIRIERRAVDGPGKYRVHVRELELARIAPELVNDEAYTGDFCHE